MASNVQKTHLALSLNRLAEQKAQSAIQQLGKALPASVVAVTNSIVTVKFEVTGAWTLPNVTMPLFGPEYVRYPIQMGCKGVVFPADAYLGGMSGLGGGVADLSTPANLSALVFFPIGNSGWSTTDDPNALVLYGPNGVVMRDAGNTSNITITPGNISMSAGGHTIVINSSGVTIDGKVFLTHHHSGVQTGGGQTGSVV